MMLMQIRVAEVARGHGGQICKFAIFMAIFVPDERLPSSATLETTILALFVFCFQNILTCRGGRWQPVSPRGNDLGGEKRSPRCSFLRLHSSTLSCPGQRCAGHSMRRKILFARGKTITKRRGEGKLCCREAIASRGPPMLKQDTELYKGLFG